MADRSKAWAAAWCGVLATAAAAHAADVPAVQEMPARSTATLNERWSATLASEVRYFSWRGLRGAPTNINGNAGRGTQVYAPFAVQLIGQPNENFKIEMLGRGGWVRTRQSTAGLSGEVSTLTDTVASGTVTYLGFDGFQPFASLNTNMPTGKSALFGPAANARMDPDLVEISSFGEGWNIGPSVGFNLPVTPSLIVTMSAGYTWRGPFDRESSTIPIIQNVSPAAGQSPTSINPGDVFTGTAAVAYKNGPWSTTLLASISEETKTVERGVALYKPGRRYLGSATVNYSWPESWGVTTFTASMAHSVRNDVLFLATPALLIEPMNTNSNLYQVGLQHLVPIGELWLGPTGSFLLRDNNSYNSITLQYVPAKERYATGFVARYAASEKVTLNAKVERVWTHEDDKESINGQQFSVLANAFVLSSAVPVVSSTGWQIAGGLNVKF